MKSKSLPTAPSDHRPAPPQGMRCCRGVGYSEGVSHAAPSAPRCTLESL